MRRLLFRAVAELKIGFMKVFVSFPGLSTPVYCPFGVSDTGTQIWRSCVKIIEAKGLQMKDQHNSDRVGE